MTNRNSRIAAGLAFLAFGQVAAAQTAILPAYRPQLDESVLFPEPARAARKAGAFVPPRNVILVTPGMTKPQIYSLLDAPHFHEGFNVRRWNYILNFYTGNGDEYIACQYQIRFGSGGKVVGTYFRDSRCVNLLERQLAPGLAAASILPVPAPPIKPQNLQTIPARTFDFTFAFNSAAIGLRGMEVLREAATEIRRGNYKEAIVTGFTDTAGSIEYNDTLSARRAAAAAEALRELAPEIPVYARASRDLEVPTSADAREERNRRVQIELYATALARPAPSNSR